jgi:hypothetical protein
LSRGRLRREIAAFSQRTDPHPDDVGLDAAHSDSPGELIGHRNDAECQVPKKKTSVGSFSGFGEVIENLSLLALGKLGAIEIDSHLDAAIGGACECLQDWPIGQDICGHVDFIPRLIDQGDVDVFEIFARRIVNARRWLGAAWRREQREEKAGRDATACYPQSYPGHFCS